MKKEESSGEKKRGKPAVTRSRASRERRLGGERRRPGPRSALAPIAIGLISAGVCFSAVLLFYLLYYGSGNPPRPSVHPPSAVPEAATPSTPAAEPSGALTKAGPPPTPVAPAPDALAGLEKWLKLLPEERGASVPDAELTREQAEKATRLIFTALCNEARRDRAAELSRKEVVLKGRGEATLSGIKSGVVKAAGKEMRLLERSFGKPAPEAGPSLWISMHGGGGAPAQVNDSQWLNQIVLYQPEEGIYVAPRAPTNSWNLWHEGHMDALIDRLIENYVILYGIDTNRVYLMGYSAGGDGVYQLAPRMADRFAAASMMAGHPNNASPLGLRNLPFMIWAGELDKAYNRNKVAAEWGKKLDDLAAADPGGYPHETHIVKGKGHWMDRADGAALPWMAKRERQAWPRKLVWHQKNRLHERFYWLAVPDGSAKDGQTVRAEVTGQKIVLQSDGVERITLRLSDQLVDLDREIEVSLNGKGVFSGKAGRAVSSIYSSLLQRLDPRSVASATVDVKVESVEEK